MNNIILCAAIGGLAALVISVPAIIIEIVRHGQVKNLPLVVDVKSFFDFRLSQLATFFIGIFLHVFMGIIFGLVYPVLVNREWWNFVGQPYEIFSLVIYSLVVWLVFSLIIFPLFGLGFFGRREGKMVWLEALVSFLLIAILFNLVAPWFKPVFF